MKQDPIRANVLENTGAYLWQIAAYLVGAESPRPPRPVALRRPAVPVVPDPCAAWLHVAPGEAVARWADGTTVHDEVRTPLLAPRGTRVTIAVNPGSASFVETTADVAVALRRGTTIGDLPAVDIFGRGQDPQRAVMSLVRHGLVTVDRDLRSRVRWGVRREPCVQVLPDDDGSARLVNPLNGRFLSVNATGASFLESIGEAQPLTDGPSPALDALAAAGVVHYVGALP